MRILQVAANGHLSGAGAAHDRILAPVKGKYGPRGDVIGVGGLHFAKEVVGVIVHGGVGARSDLLKNEGRVYRGGICGGGSSGGEEVLLLRSLGVLWRRHLIVVGQIVEVVEIVEGVGIGRGGGKGNVLLLSQASWTTSGIRMRGAVGHGVEGV